MIIYKSLNTEQTDWKNMHCKAPVGQLSIPKFINIKFLLDHDDLVSSRRCYYNKTKSNKIILPWAVVAVTTSTMAVAATRMMLMPQATADDEPAG